MRALHCGCWASVAAWKQAGNGDLLWLKGVSALPQQLILFYGLLTDSIHLWPRKDFQYGISAKARGFQNTKSMHQVHYSGKRATVLFFCLRGLPLQKLSTSQLLIV